MNLASPACKLLPGILFVLSILAFAQTAKPTVESIDDTVIDREPATWTSPESVLSELRSANDETRLKALKLAGLNDQQAHYAVWSQVNDGTSKIIGQAVVTPKRTQLMYAALGEDASQQAVIAFDDGIQSVYAAVAVHKGNGWERIAALTCWCKYDMRPEQDTVSESVSLRPAIEPGSPDNQIHRELVVHSSGGGSGVYSQSETHFRVYHNQLRNIISFTSAYRNGTPTVTLERRWFTFLSLPNLPAPDTLRGVLVEAKGTWEPDNAPTIQWDVRALLDRHLRSVTCTAYRWDEKTFSYVRTNETVPACSPYAKSQ